MWVSLNRGQTSGPDMNPDMSAKKDEDIKAMSVSLRTELTNLIDELKVGSFISRNYDLTYTLEFSNTHQSLQFSEAGQGGFGQCFLVTPMKNAPELLVRSGKFLAKKLKESTDQNEIVKEIARILLITHLGHYGIVESHTIEVNINDNEVEGPLILIEFDPSQKMTIYATMKYIEGRPLAKAIDEKELTDYDKLRIAVRIADTMNFLHSYKLAHCDLSCENVMVTQGTNDPILIDFGSMKTSTRFYVSKWDTSSYHDMIFMMYCHCNAGEIPAVVKPIFDKWDDEDHRKMSFKDITDKYFEKLSAYHAFASVADGATGFSNTVPVKRVGAGIVMVSFEAIGKSRSFTEYMEQVGVSLAEQDKKIKDYVETK